MGRHKSSGRGVAKRWLTPPGVLIFNFDSDSAQLKPEHRNGLQSWVVPELQRGSAVAIVGYADRVGTTAHNQYLSQLRAERTLEFLRSAVRNGFAARPVVGLGELEAKFEGYRDNHENPRFRSVLVLPGPGPIPSKTSLSQVLDDERLPETNWWDRISQGVDIAIGMEGILELLVVEEIAFILGTVGIGLNVVAAVMLMPVLWYGVREQNLTNGGIQGYWEAMQDMADQYKDPKLSTLAQSKWPAIKEPQPRSFGLPESVLPMNEREWMEGRRQGCRAAYEMIKKRDENPKNLEGQTIGGRQLLQKMAHDYGSGVGDEIHRLYDLKLLKVAGMRWPLYK